MKIVFTLFFSTIFFLFSCTSSNKEIISKWENGTTKLERVYSNTPNIFIEREFYENGQLANESRIQNSKRNGKSISYYNNGSLLGISYYQEGKINGEVLEYYRNGNLMFKATQANGKLVGKALHYYENGQPKTELFYKNNQKQLVYQWDSSGKLLVGQNLK